MASLGSGLRATDAFLVSTLSKHLLRETRLADAAVKDPEALRYNTAQRRYGVVGSVMKADPDDVPDDEDEVEAPAAVAEFEHAKLPTKANPVNVAVYGQILLAAKSYQSALCECYALEVIEATVLTPDQSICCRRTIMRPTIHSFLCVLRSPLSGARCRGSPIIDTISSLKSVLCFSGERSSSFVRQGMAFLTRYRELRGDTAEGLDEVEYNFGRVFHQLGKPPPPGPRPFHL